MVRLGVTQLSVLGLLACDGSRAEVSRSDPPAARATAERGPRADRVVAAFAGSGTANTRSFTVTGPWVLRWEATGGPFELLLLSESGDFVSTAASQQAGGVGRADQPRRGSYYLQINATGSWSVQVVQLP